MLSPVLVTPPASLPVTLAEAKLHLRVDGTEEDTLITGLIQAAVSHLDGWTGILGRALVEQTWRQDFDTFGCSMRLGLGPVTEIVSVTWRNEAGQVATVASSNYALVTDGIGPKVFWDSGFSSPSGLYEQGAVSVTFKAGYPDDEDGNSTVPAAIKVAILLMIGHWFSNRSAVEEGNFTDVPMSANALLAPFRRMNF